MKLGLFLYDFFQKHKDQFRGVAFHDWTEPPLLRYSETSSHDQVFVYDADAKLVQDLTATIGYGMSGWFGDFYYLESDITPPITPPFFITNLPNVRLVYRGPVAVDSLERKFRRQYSDAVWLGVTGQGWFGALRIKRRGWIFRKDQWELYAYAAEPETICELPGPVFQPDGIDGPDALFLRITELLAK